MTKAEHPNFEMVGEIESVLEENIQSDHLRDWYRGLVSQFLNHEIPDAIANFHQSRLVALEQSKSPRNADDMVWAILLAFDKHLF